MCLLLHSEHDITPQEAYKILPRVLKRHERVKKSKNALKQRFRRMKKRVESLEQALEEARNRNLISQCAEDHLKVLYITILANSF